mmetsp:Transcript_48006/g.114098  ORF Transcript_48006/g.114098 Transcript_48006/m.114098 type:complete len:243 (-) Transcript_48006:1024-1752(-)
MSMLFKSKLRVIIRDWFCSALARALPAPSRRRLSRKCIASNVEFCASPAAKVAPAQSSSRHELRLMLCSDGAESPIKSATALAASLSIGFALKDNVSMDLFSVSAFMMLMMLAVLSLHWAKLSDRRVELTDSVTTKDLTPMSPPCGQSSTDSFCRVVLTSSASSTRATAAFEAPLPLTDRTLRPGSFICTSSASRARCEAAAAEAANASRLAASSVKDKADAETSYSARLTVTAASWQRTMA